MRLTVEEQAWLCGEGGPALQKAIQIVVTLGRIYGAECLLPVSSVQIAGVSYRNLGDPGIEFLNDWASLGARVRVPATLNPAGMDLRRWREMGISEGFAAKQLRVVEAYSRMGVEPTCTCTPYLVGNTPALGEHIAWSESSAVCYANSVLGARTNREGGPSALASAICGRTAAFGLHLDSGRRATHRVRVRCAVREAHEYAALGYLVGSWVGGGVPFFEGLQPAPDEGAMRDALKLLGAALASSGSVALFHIAGLTPEAREDAGICPSDAPELVVDSLQPAVEALDGRVGQIDLVVIGCPHASLEELREVARLVRGRRLRSMLWVTTARRVLEQGEAEGIVQAIEEAGGRVVADGCVVVAPTYELPYRTLATNSAKMASYAMPHAGFRVRFGSLERCIETAVTGKWEAVRSRRLEARVDVSIPSLARSAMVQAPDTLSGASGGLVIGVRKGDRGQVLRGRAVVSGRASGLALVSDRPISLLGGVDPESGEVIEAGHPLQGQSVSGRVLVFPTGKGSTVGSYVLYRLAKAGLAPSAIVNACSEPIVAVGALIAGIPMVDQVDISSLHSGMSLQVSGEEVSIE